MLYDLNVRLAPLALVLFFSQSPSSATDIDYSWRRNYSIAKQTKIPSIETGGRTTFKEGISSQQQQLKALGFPCSFVVRGDLVTSPRKFKALKCRNCSVHEVLAKIASANHASLTYQPYAVIFDGDSQEAILTHLELSRPYSDDGQKFISLYGPIGQIAVRKSGMVVEILADATTEKRVVQELQQRGIVKYSTSTMVHWPFANQRGFDGQGSYCWEPSKYIPQVILQFWRRLSPPRAS